MQAACKQSLDREATPFLHPLQHSRTQVGTHEKRAQTVYNRISPTTEISAYTIKIISDAGAVNRYPKTNEIEGSQINQYRPTVPLHNYK